MTEVGPRWQAVQTFLLALSAIGLVGCILFGVIAGPIGWMVSTGTVVVLIAAAAWFARRGKLVASVALLTAPALFGGVSVLLLLVGLF